MIFLNILGVFCFGDLMSVLPIEREALCSALARWLNPDSSHSPETFSRLFFSSLTLDA